VFPLPCSDDQGNSQLRSRSDVGPLFSCARPRPRSARRVPSEFPCRRSSSARITTRPYLGDVFARAPRTTYKLLTRALQLHPQAPGSSRSTFCCVTRFPQQTVPTSNAKLNTHLLRRSERCLVSAFPAFVDCTNGQHQLRGKLLVGYNSFRQIFVVFRFALGSRYVVLCAPRRWNVSIRSSVGRWWGVSWGVWLRFLLGASGGAESGGRGGKGGCSWGGW